MSKFTQIHLDAIANQVHQGASSDFASAMEWLSKEDIRFKGLYFEDLGPSDFTALDDLVFWCAWCGWWCTTDELGPNGNETVCEECYSLEDEMEEANG